MPDVARAPLLFALASAGSSPRNGGIFIVMALAWGYVVDGFRPDRWDIVGAAVCLVGVLIIFFGPRGTPA